MFGLVLLASGCAPQPDGQAAAGPPQVDPQRWPAARSPLAPDAGLESRVDELLAAMSLEEKVGQVIQAEIRHVTPEDVRTYHLGSVLNGGGGWPGNDKYATPADWLGLADAFWQASMDDSDGARAIPILWGLDAVHGHGNVIGTTLFPHNVGLGAARNPDLVRRIGEVTAREIRVTGQDWNFGPCVAVARDDRWGRTYESYSEDPEVVAAYAAAMTEGLQGKPAGPDLLGGERVLATAKHFLGDGATDGGRDQGDSLASEEELRDLHAPGYVAAIEAGVQTVMASYNSWHGRKMHGHRELLTGVLKGRMGFDGFVVGDWNGHGQLPGCANDSCAPALNAGVDMFMVPKDWRRLYENTLEQARAGEIPVARLDDAVRRILRVKMRAGLFERPKPSERPLGGRTELLGAAEHRAVARQAVRESLVLLKNNGGLLPLAPGQRVLVAGDGADDIGKQTGGWTITWQGTGNTNADFPGATSIWAGLREAVEAAGGTAELSPEGRWSVRPDVAIVVYGEQPYAEFVGDRQTVAYSPESTRDLELLRRLGEDGIPVVSIFLTGRPLWVNPELNASDAFVVAWLPGSEGAGVADVVLAAADGSPRHDFRGRLSFSWPADATGEPLNRDDPDYRPLFAYGYGLSYAAGGEVAELPEEDGIDRRVLRSAAVYFAGGPLPPWKLYLAEASGAPVAAPAASAATPRGHLVLRAVDRRRQEDARSVRWSGAGPARIYLEADSPMNLSREANGDMALAFDLRVEEPAASAVTLEMGCGDSCSGAVDLSAALAGLPTGSWQTLRVSLRCLAEAGAEMSRIDTPFALVTDGALAVSLAEIRLVPANDGETICPPPPAG